MIVLGVDPGTAALGYGVVERRDGHLRAVDYGVLTTDPVLPLPERLAAVHAWVVELIELHRPAAMAVERLFFSRNAQTALGVGQARGVVLLAAAQEGVAVVEATPNEVKQAVAGFGRADKGAVTVMVQRILALEEPPRPDDAADALAVAIWLAHVDLTRRLRSVTGPRDLSAVTPGRRSPSPFGEAVRRALEDETLALRGG
jgi:crossover junction endodeoxyribonuclease RuvC